MTKTGSFPFWVHSLTWHELFWCTWAPVKEHASVSFYYPPNSHHCSHPMCYVLSKVLNTHMCLKPPAVLQLISLCLEKQKQDGQSDEQQKQFLHRPDITQVSQQDLVLIILLRAGPYNYSSSVPVPTCFLLVQANERQGWKKGRTWYYNSWSYPPLYPALSWAVATSLAVNTFPPLVQVYNLAPTFFLAFTIIAFHPMAAAPACQPKP